mmetsp:Transcript_35065/g.111402  ORF Transcript_35065/g.111402 Transcript_35065/m.111402 type:complete len:449 (-) Transcript_35065:759-2105(-)
MANDIVMKESVVTITDLVQPSCPAESWSNSWRHTYTMAPAANARPSGSSHWKRSTNRKAARASSGCGTLVRVAMIVASGADTPRGTSTNATASPSGMLWTAKSNDTYRPNCARSCLLKATPTAIPSAAEWQNITVKISMAFLKWRFSTKALCKATTCSSSSSSSSPPACNCSLHLMKSPPATNPARICQSIGPQCSCASISMLTDAESIMPLATAFAMARGPSPTALAPTNKKGKAPRPVVMHVSQPYAKTRSDSYAIRSKSCMQTMSVHTPIHSEQRPWKNWRRKEGQAAESVEAAEAPAGPASAEGRRQGGCCPGSTGPDALAWSSRSQHTPAQTWLRPKAKMEAAQPFANISMPSQSGIRLPATLLKKTPSTDSAVPLRARATKVENCGRYHWGPMYLFNANETVTPSRGIAPKKRKDADVASPDFRAAVPPRGNCMPSSSVIMW